MLEGEADSQSERSGAVVLNRRVRADALNKRISQNGRSRSEDRRRERELMDLLDRVAAEGAQGEIYGGVEDYDPVLRWHCRIDSE